MANQLPDHLGERMNEANCVKCGQPMDVAGLEPLTPVTCPQCGTAQWAPLRMGHFVLLEFLGEGGMGRVYRALDEALNRQVAIKVMHPELARQQENAEAFIREARVAAALNHPNVVQIYTCEMSGDQVFLVMELLTGGRMDKMMELDKNLDERRMLHVALDVENGLSAAQGAKLVHGDIKPANILFDANGAAKVTDFGLARFGGLPAQQEGLWGTPYYIAPEKVRGQPETVQSDIYSLGATLYHALTGRPPFDGENSKEVVVARLDHVPPDIRTLRPDLNEKTASVIMRMLEEDPFKRYPNHESLITDLQETLQEVETGAATRAARKKKIILISSLSAVGLLLVVGAVAWMLLRPVPVPVKVVPEVKPATNKPPVAVSNAVAVVTNAPPVEKTADIQPFTVAQGEAIQQAVTYWMAKDTNQLSQSMQALNKAVPESRTAAFWLQMLRADMDWLEAQTNAATSRLTYLTGAEFKDQPAAGARHPQQFIKALGRYLLGQTSETDLRQEAAQWPAWCGDYAAFFVGVQQLRQGDLPGAQTNLNQYLTAATPAVRWSYAFRPVADKLLDQVQRWKTLLLSVEPLIEAKNYKAAASAFRNFRAGTSRHFYALADAKIAEMEQAQNQIIEAEKQAEAARKQAADEAHRLSVQADMAVVEQARAVGKTVLVNREFQKARIDLFDFQPKLKTAEGRAALDSLSQQFERMENLKTFVAQSLRTRPYPGGGGELGGNVTAQSSSGLQISLGVGTVSRPWAQVTPKAYGLMAEYFIGNMGLPPAQQAQQWLALAIYCQWTGLTKPAANFAKRAVTLDPSIKPKIEQCLPGILAG